MFNQSLLQLGWKPFFQQQLTFSELESTQPFRVVAQHRSHYLCQGEPGVISLPVFNKTRGLAVGDWLLCNQGQQFVRALESFARIERKAAGSQLAQQTIACNVDTVFIVMSMNQDFNLNRLDRYLALVNASQAQPVVVLTKQDLCAAPDIYLEQVRISHPNLMLESVNAADQDSTACLAAYCRTGQTIALLGSSGVGKSTLVNSLSNEQVQPTGSIRQDDAKGRHTTTARHIQSLPQGGLLLDTPGMRELQLVNADAGVQQAFSDVTAFIGQCKFSDCQHQAEPGCAVQQAIRDGTLDLKRWQNYCKLSKEERCNSESIKDRRHRQKQLSKLYRRTMKAKTATKDIN